MLDGVIITPLKIISVPGGDVLHAMKNNDSGFDGFGEAYFSTIKSGVIKAWKRHHQMTLNLVVPVGAVKFVLYDERDSSSSKGEFSEVVISKDNYVRLTVPPGLWMGFKCVGNIDGLLLNIANIPHAADEVDKKTIDEINFDWNVKK